MKLYLDNIPMGDVPGPRRQLGEFFPQLVGIKVSRGGDGPLHDVDIEPLYVPRLRISRRAGQVMIEINSDRPLAYITLQRRAPYIHVFRFPWWQWDRENELNS